MGRQNFKFNGFTLIEVIVIVSILAFLGSMVLNSIAGQIYKGNDAKRKADLARLQVAFEDYEKDRNCYPPFTTVTQPDMLPYLDKIPKDPRIGSPYGMEAPGSCPYYYKLYAKLENSQDGDIAKTGCSPNCGGSYTDYNYKITSPNAP